MAAGLAGAADAGATDAAAEPRAATPSNAAVAIFDGTGTDLQR
jgi:hypothetical protein